MVVAAAVAVNLRTKELKVKLVLQVDLMLRVELLEPNHSDNSTNLKVETQTFWVNHQDFNHLIAKQIRSSRQKWFC